MRGRLSETKDGWSESDELEWLCILQDSQKEERANDMTMGFNLSQNQIQGLKYY